MYDITALGELLIDFTPAGKSENGEPLFEQNPGGAPCNMLAMATKLGAKTAFIGKVGNDTFGKNLHKTISDLGIEASGLCMDSKANTSLAFVHLADNGERDFTFYRNPGADELLTSEELNVELLENTKIFHFGTISCTRDPSRQATYTALNIAKSHGSLISFDPNLRRNLWDNLDMAKEQMLYGFKNCDILKISEDELEFSMGTSDPLEGSEKLWGKYGIKLIFVTMGENGSFCRCGGSLTTTQPAFPIKTIDTTGAGDTFFGCCVQKVLEAGIDNINKDSLDNTLLFANAAASIVASRKGALKRMPSLNEIQEVLQKR